MLPSTYRKLTDKHYFDLWAVYEGLKVFIRLYEIEEKTYIQELINNLHSTLLELNTLQINKEDAQ